MNITELADYFQALEAQDRFSGVALITQGDTQRFAGPYSYASRAWQVKNTLVTRFDHHELVKLYRIFSPTGRPPRE